MLEISLKGTVEEIKKELLQLVNVFGVVVPESVKKEAIEAVTEEIVKEEKTKKVKKEKTEVKEIEAEALEFEKDIKPLAIKAIKNHQAEVKAFLDDLGLERLSAAKTQEQLQQLKTFLEGLV